MGTFITVILVAGILYFVVKYTFKSKLKISDDYFEQYGVKVNFKEGSIIINNNTYKVNQVTGITVVKGGGGLLAETRGVRIDVDDLKKPVHKIFVSGLDSIDGFAQRLSVAIRKAGGPSFV